MSVGNCIHSHSSYKADICRVVDYHKSEGQWLDPSSSSVLLYGTVLRQNGKAEIAPVSAVSVLYITCLTA